MSRLISITINNKLYKVSPKQTILDICRDNDIFIPTLCKHPDLPAMSKCRVCLVQVSGKGLVTSCSTPVEDGMVVKTNSIPVKRARAINLEMIYAEHIEKCATCIQDNNCLLKKYAHDYQLKITRFKDRKKELPIWHFGAWSQDKLEERIKEIKNTFSDLDINLREEQAKLHAAGYIQFDSTKCIDCGICTEICSHIQTCNFYTTVGKGHSTQTKPTDDIDKDCSYCGQCIVHCPVGAVQGVPHWQNVENILKDKQNKTIIAQIAPSIRVSIGEEFGLDYGQVVTGQLAASIKALGFDAAFDVTVGADLTTYEEARELINWLESGKDRPMFTSCCPGWVKFVETYYPDIVPHLTTTRSPHLHLGIIAKTYWAKLLKKNPQDIIVVSIMPCTAKKNEISLDRHLYEFNQSGKRIKIPIVDYVLTTREYAHLLRRAKVDFANLKSEKMDNPLGISSGAGVIYGASAGVMESALRTADYFLRVKKETGSLKSVINGSNYRLNKNKFSHISQNRIDFKEVRGQQGIKDATVVLAGKKLKIAIVNGLGNARYILESIRSKKCKYDYVEVMACPGGCIGGGGQPVPTSRSIRAKRAAALYNIDKKLSFRSAHDNFSLLNIYQSYFQGDQDLIEELMHCQYNKIDRGGYTRV